MKSISLRVLVGALAGLLAWILCEPAAPANIQSTGWSAWQNLFTGVMGAFIGAGIGGVTGFITGGKVHTLRGLALGAVFGFIGVMLGASIGAALLNATFGQGALQGSLVVATLARIIALTPIGSVLGAAIGASTLSWKRTIHGLIGGTLGGGVGAAIFDTVGKGIADAVIQAKGLPPGSQAEVGSLSRVLYAVALGAGIGLFIGLVEKYSQSAWLRLQLGRNEGKEWPIYGQQTTVGRAENCAVPIFGDPSVQPYHAMIAENGGQYTVVDTGGGVLLDGHPVSQAPLYSGATIQIGNTRLVFLMKQGGLPARGPESYAGAFPIGGNASFNPPAAYPNPPPPAQPTMMAPSPMIPQPASQATVAIAAQSMALSLVATDGPLAGQRFAVTQPIEIGRECPAIPMSFDASASRRHASAAPVAGGLAVNDLGSTNGIYVNGQRVQSATLGPGQMVKIGSTTFRVE